MTKHAQPGALHCRIGRLPGGWQVRSLGGDAQHPAVIDSVHRWLRVEV